MHVTIVAPMADERTARQERLLMAGGHVWQRYVQEQGIEGTTATVQEFLAAEHVRKTALFIFLYTDGPYPLLEAMRWLQHGLVVLDLRAATMAEQAPVHCADLCLVTDAAQRRTLNEATGYALERICALSDRQSEEEILHTMIEQAIQETPTLATENWGQPGPAVADAVGDLETLLLIRDPTVDRTAILERVRGGIQRRLAAGGYGRDVATLGPESLQADLSEEGPELSDDEEDGVTLETLLWCVQMRLDDLAARSRLQEPEFHSGVPLLGRLIVAVRRLWNWMSAKWYVRGWMAQQMSFNNQVVEVVGELLRIQENNRQRIDELERELERFLADREEVV